ncbi:hypothetical protein ARMSODRAFT_1019985 [Armillaria solidipes]|uniref:Uncharacterized protein n=1 Tax=Armillaria solidipes TaxID=1076256 RepID=A0A2H3BAM5_9AGAR|nr:hypothetical protein ARMSODRAFT_1019985 [Armillaria solidipes]
MLSSGSVPPSGSPTTGTANLVPQQSLPSSTSPSKDLNLPQGPAPSPTSESESSDGIFWEPGTLKTGAQSAASIFRQVQEKTNNILKFQWSKGSYQRFETAKSF